MGIAIARRKFIAALGAATAWPLATRAQQPAMPVIGLLGDQAPASRQRHLAKFRQGLSEEGYDEGRNVTIEYRWAEGHYERLPALAQELVSRHPALITAVGALVASLAAKSATTTIPVLFSSGSDPVQLGLVTSLNRPGGNVTGVTMFGNELEPKRLGLLRLLVPQAPVIAVLLNPDNPQVGIQWRDLNAVAQSIGVQLAIANARSESDFDQAFADFAQHGAGGLLVGMDASFIEHRERLTALASRYALPTISGQREFAEAGGLMSYGASIPDVYSQLGVYAGRILKGAKPADLPVVQPTKFEFVINMKTAKALGLDVPASVQLLADEVIE